MALANSSGWYGVRCIFKHGEPLYEERVTLWHAPDFNHAIELAEAEAARYAEDLSETENPTVYVEFAQVYELADDPHEQGAEVFSLIRESDLKPSEYIDTFFATGDGRRVRGRGLTSPYRLLDPRPDTRVGTVTTT